MGPVSSGRDPRALRYRHQTKRAKKRLWRRRKASSRWRAPWSRRYPTRCSGWSWPTGTRSSRTSAARCASTTSASSRRIGSWWSCRRTTSAAVASSTDTSEYTHATRPEVELHEGQSEREEDLREVQGDSSPRHRQGDLREPTTQATAGLNLFTPQHQHLM